MTWKEPACERRHNRASRLKPITAIAIWLFVLPQIIPDVTGSNPDRGVFVSVAERLRAGDTLYSEVWDNKDPAFYYLIALGRSLTPYMDIVTEFALIVAGVLAVRSITGQIDRDDESLCHNFAAITTPLVLTGGFYYAGLTHLPGVVLCLLIARALLSGKMIQAGAIAGALLFTKLVMLPIAAWIILVEVVFHRDRATLWRIASGFAVAATALAIVMHWRGELEPYRQTLIANVQYSSAGALDPRFHPLVGHVIAIGTPGTMGVVTACILCLLVTSTIRPLPERSDASTPIRILRSWLLGSVIIGFSTLLVTGMTDHHVQILYVSSIFSLILVHSTLKPVRLPPKHVAPMMVTVALLFGGVSLPHYFRSLAGAPRAFRGLTQVSAEAQAVLGSGGPRTYARVGAVDDGHAYGLGEWALSCPRFHQYDFLPSFVLDEALHCLPSAHVILVSDVNRVPGKAAWNAYLDGVERLLGSDYRCSPFYNEGAFSGRRTERICVRRE